MKKFVRLFFVMTAISLLITGCKKDDDNDSNSLEGGYWIISDYQSDIINTLEDPESDGYLGGAIDYKFVSNNTIRYGLISYYNSYHSGSIHTETIKGKTIYFVWEDDKSATYTRKDNGLYTSEGDIFTLDGSNLYRNTYSQHWIKVNW